MLRKIIISLGYTILCLIFALYFVFGYRLRQEDKKAEICKHIKIRILDSAENRFVTPMDVMAMIQAEQLSPLNQNIHSIDINKIEKLLSNKGAIKESNVAYSNDGTLHVDVTQRKPVLRIQTSDGGFYIDNEQYIFPLSESFTSYVPVVTGNIPIKLAKGYRGKIEKEGSAWLKNIMKLGAHINESEFLNAQIQEINVEANQDISLYTRVGNQVLLFGELDRMSEKFDKLEQFYANIIPVYGWEKYSKVNLKYNGQIVCTKRR